MVDSKCRWVRKLPRHLNKLFWPIPNKRILVICSVSSKYYDKSSAYCAALIHTIRAIFTRIMGDLYIFSAMIYCFNISQINKTAYGLPFLQKIYFVILGTIVNTQIIISPFIFMPIRVRMRIRTIKTQTYGKFNFAFNIKYLYSYTRISRDRKRLALADT